jgi:hypothetical protein
VHTLFGPSPHTLLPGRISSAFLFSDLNTTDFERDAISMTEYNFYYLGKSFGIFFSTSAVSEWLKKRANLQDEA